MGHYDDQYSYDAYERTIRSERQLIKEVQSGKYQILIDAANVGKTDHVLIHSNIFSRMLDLIRRLDGDTHTFKWEK